MLTNIALVLNAGFDAALITVLAYLVLRNRKRALGMVLTGLLFGFTAMVLLMGFGERELIETVLEGTVLIVAMLLVVFTLSQNRKMTNAAVFVFSALVIAKGLYRVLLFPRQIFIQNTSLVNSDLALAILGASAGISILCFAALTALQIGERVGIEWDKLFLFSALLLALKPFIEVIRFIFITGLLPLTDFVMALLIPVLNNITFFSYMGYLIFSALIVISYGHWRKLQPASIFANPAEARKFKAERIFFRRWLNGALLVLLLAVTVLSGDYVLANRQVELSAAVPVEAENDMVHIGRQQVNDGDLHRFSYTTGGVEVRFLIIHKGSGVYGVGLDACDICGVTGYYQRKKDVVCLNCDVIISTPTIGFTGGCNPIPIKYKKNEQDIIIFTDELEQHVEVFKQ